MIERVDVFVRVLQTPPAKKGLAIVLYRYKGNIKDFYFSTFEITQNRSIILASIIAIEGLKFGYDLNLHTQTNFGFKYTKNSKKWVNRDIGEHLNYVIERGGHEVTFIDCLDTDESKDYQQALAVRLKPFKI